MGGKQGKSGGGQEDEGRRVSISRGFPPIALEATGNEAAEALYPLPTGRQNGKAEVDGTMKKGHRIDAFEEAGKFVERMAEYDAGLIRCSEHAFFRLSEKQREVHTCEELKKNAFT